MATGNTKNKRRKNKKITLDEFKAWLDGIEEVMGEDWTPTEEQWRSIREKINQIKEPEPQVVEKPAPAQNAKNNQAPQVNSQPANQPTAAPPTDENGVPVPPPPNAGFEKPSPAAAGAAGPSALDNVPPPGGAPPAPQAPQAPPAPPAMDQGAGGADAQKTPDLDTSSGQYKSGFV